MNDVYDLMPDGPDQRRHNKERLALLEAEREERLARMAQVKTVVVEAVEPRK